ncbi:MAG: LPS-assembly protein LptD [Deltaproteobacteria bacterium]|nr:LPS-assembly protein LptD [Deltaproteobacteria bacterium]MCB9487148.1 LPS-assembly protein LptD [Deltaproteobacteria bacterium]
MLQDDRFFGGRLRAVVFVCLALLVATLTTLAPAPVLAQDAADADDDTPTPPIVDELFSSDQPIVLSADRVAYDAKADVYEAEGNVEVRQGDVYVKAQRLMLDMGGMIASASGDVEMGNADGKLYSPSIDINFATQKGVIVAGSLVVHTDDVNYYFRGSRIEKVGQNRYLIQDGWYSTCDCPAEEDVDWFVEAEQIDLTIDGYALVKRGRVVTGGMPVAYVPYGILPAKIRRQSGFLPPEIGWSSDDGYHLGIPFFWAINPHMDATIYSDWYQRRGVKEGVEFRYALPLRTFGQFDFDFIDDRKFDDERWAVTQIHTSNLWRRLYLRSNLNLVSDNDYVVDFPGDVAGRYDSFLRSSVILNNLWQDYSANVALEYFDDLTQEDNGATWQKAPEATLDALVQKLGPLPLAVSVNTAATNFTRDHLSDEENATLEEELDADQATIYLTDGRRYDILPKIEAPMNFNRWVFVNPYFQAWETYYDLPDRPNDEDQFEARHLYVTGGEIFTRAERVFPVVDPIIKGIKHTVEPGLTHRYIPPANQDDLPVFDGGDRVARENVTTYYLANRLWMRLLPPRSKTPNTAKLVDLKVSQSFDWDEAQREIDDEDAGEDGDSKALQLAKAVAIDPLNPDTQDGQSDERRPFGPVVTEFETLFTAGTWLNKVLVRSRWDYDLYEDETKRYSVLGALGSVNDDALGIEYRYQEDEEQDVAIDYLTGLARFTLADFLTLSYLARYSFIDDYFVERLYGAEFHSLQNCWDLVMQVEQREIPEKEIVYKLSLNLTGLVAVGSSF